MTDSYRDFWEQLHAYLTTAQHRERQLVEACQLALDFHGADTPAFVTKYGAGMGTREMCDRIRKAMNESQPWEEK